MPENFNSVRNQFKEIIGDPPNWLITRGLISVLLVWILLTGTGYILEIPQTLEARITIIPDSRPTPVIIPFDSAVIARVAIHNQDVVHKGQQLFFFTKSSQNILCSPKDGELFLNRYLSPNFMFKRGDTIAYVIKRDRQIYGYAQIEVNKAEDIFRGQSVHISILGFPTADFGFLTGIVTEILLTNKGTTCNVQIEIPGTMMTNLHKQIPAREIISGNALFTNRKKNIFSLLD